MKKIYKKPSTEFVVVKCNEKLMWGEMGTISQTQDHADSKEGTFEDVPEETIPTYKGIWDDEKPEE